MAILAVVAAAAPGPTAERTMFRGDPRHAGVVDTLGVEELASVRWRFATDGPVRSSPALLGGTLYFGSVDGGVYAVEATGGQQLWRADVGTAVISSPAVDAARVYVVDRRQTVSALDRRTGHVVWATPTGADLPLPWGLEGWDYFNSSPTLVGGLVLVGSGDGTLYALEASSGRIRWRYPAGARIRSTPAVADGVVFLGDGAGFVHAVDLADGAGRWRFETVGHGLDSAAAGFDRRQISSSPAVLDGTVYVGSRDARLYALDADEGTLRWAAEDGTSAWVIASPAVAGDRVYSARSSSRLVRALARDSGEEVWRRTVDGFVFASPVLVDDVLYVADGAGMVRALDAADGAERWRYRPGGGIQATPVVADGTIYVATDDGAVYALERGADRTPRVAVYHDESLRERAVFGAAEPHARLVRHFAAAGYETLDAPSLEVFLAERVDDRTTSVIVFAMDALPESVVGERGLLRRYLDAGGKVIWPSPYPPDVLARDADGRVTGLDRSRPGRLLGVDLAVYNSDRYQARPTSAGRRQGLRTPWMGIPLASSEAVETVLATDELGRAMAWAQGYGGGEGTGFVALYPALDAERLEEIRAVAEYGVLRFPTIEGPSDDPR